MHSSTSNETMSFPPPSAPPEPPPLPPFTPHPFRPTPPVPTGNTSSVNVGNQKSDITTLKFPSTHSPGPWSTGLCGCCEDFSSCCLTCWCPCVAFGRIAEIVDRGSTSCGVSGALYLLIMSVTGCSCLCSCLYSCFYRSKLRGQYFLDESPCADCCVHCCCEICALCQEYRELQNQGFDMSIGWHGNMERQKRGVAAAEPPTVQNSMNRWE